MTKIYEQVQEARRVVAKCGYKDISAVITLNKYGSYGFHFDSNNIYKTGDLIGSGENALRVVRTRYFA